MEKLIKKSYMRLEVTPTFHLLGAIKKLTMDRRGTLEKKITVNSIISNRATTINLHTRNPII